MAYEQTRIAMKSAAAIQHYQPRFRLPSVRGTIERRLLINFRCEPAVLAKLVPLPFRPKLVQGWSVAGICLIRLGGMRPAFFPTFGISASENAAHRIAVEWNEGGRLREGVFIPRRDTNAWLNRVLGGKLFPGIQHAAKFEVHEANDRFQIKMQSEDKLTAIQIAAHPAEALPEDSVFGSLAEASEFFRGGAVGWSSRADAKFDGLELVCHQWQMEPLAVEYVESSFFSNLALFPPGSTKFDSALLMRDLAHEWQSRGQLAVEETKTS